MKKEIRQYTILIKTFKAVKVNATSPEQAMEYADVNNDLDVPWGWDLDEAFVENLDGEPVGVRAKI